MKKKKEFGYIVCGTGHEDHVNDDRLFFVEGEAEERMAHLKKCLENVPGLPEIELPEGDTMETDDCLVMFDEYERDRDAFCKEHDFPVNMTTDINHFHVEKVELIESPDYVPQADLINRLLTLLDQVEIEDDASLAKGRFAILKDYGTVIFQSEGSNSKH